MSITAEKRAAKEAGIAACRKILGVTRQCTFYDLRMSPAARGVLLRAAGLPDNIYYKARRFSAWSVTERQRIVNASVDVSGWGEDLAEVAAA